MSLPDIQAFIIKYNTRDFNQSFESADKIIFHLAFGIF